ncbi:sensor histidine kinase [Nocardia pneumoniae]|uniref:sensor histidine kinase n=1 Tax=Nocardia pneumoniae TaxID=228601 RepID=UPI0002E8E0BA|nr:HAMP domain-containing sensor histidine kinase [Nocardia pneumoniae]
MVNVPSAQLRTGSLRRRVTWTSVTVMASVLAIVGVVLTTGFGVAADRAMDSILDDRLRLAQQQARKHASPAELVRRVETGVVKVRLVLRDRTVFGGLEQHRIDDGSVKLRKTQLKVEGRFERAMLTLGADTGLLSGVRFWMMWLTTGAIVVSVVATAAALHVTTRYALRPLDTMSRLALEIARGRRGHRLLPSRTDTELGRVAAEFDSMLDSLEGAEADAQAAQERTRRFTADVAHELRTPITGIRAIADAVLAQSADDEREELQRLNELLAHETQRAGQLIDGLLDLAHLDAGGIQLDRQRVDLHILAAAQTDRVRLLHSHLDIALNSAQSVPLHADATRVTQILANLLDNACRVTPAGGHVRVTVDRTANRAEVVVTDTGPGVPAADRDRIFDRMVRLDPQADSSGSGLGLSIARGLARAHGGDLVCEEPNGGIGAAFRVWLPATIEDD